MKEKNVRRAVGVALVIAILLSGLFLTPRQSIEEVNALSWRYFTPPAGTPAAKQITYYKQLFPSRANIWPQGRMATSYAFNISDPVPTDSLPCHDHDGTGTDRKVLCQGWEARGPFSNVKIAMGVVVNWSGQFEFKDDGWFDMRWRVYCDPIQAIGSTLNAITCGVLASDSRVVTLGFYYSTTTQSNDYIPQTTVWWKSRMTCYRYEGYCLAPFTTPQA